MKKTQALSESGLPTLSLLCLLLQAFDLIRNGKTLIQLRRTMKRMYFGVVTVMFAHLTHQVVEIGHINCQYLLIKESKEKN